MAMARGADRRPSEPGGGLDRKSTRLNSSHANISYAVFCLKKKTTTNNTFQYAFLYLSFTFSFSASCLFFSLSSLLATPHTHVYLITDMPPLSSLSLYQSSS